MSVNEATYSSSEITGTGGAGSGSCSVTVLNGDSLVIYCFWTRFSVYLHYRWSGCFGISTSTTLGLIDGHPISSTQETKDLDRRIQAE